jgi:hypothetical protein
MTLYNIHITSRNNRATGVDFGVIAGYTTNMSQNPITLFEIPAVEVLGPAMRALNERQRLFVCALAYFGGDQCEAYRAAGYQVTNDNSAQAASSRLANNMMVVEAIKEEALRRLDSASLLAVSTLVELASAKTSDNKIRLQASNSLLDRIGGFAGKTEHKITIKDDRTTKELIDFIKHTAIANGLDPAKLLGAPVIDVEFSEVSMSSDGLEDLL